MGLAWSTRDPVGSGMGQDFVTRIWTGRVKKNNKIIMTSPESDLTQPIDTPNIYYCNKLKEMYNHL
jgi:hypothetical protein